MAKKATDTKAAKAAQAAKAVTQEPAKAARKAINARVKQLDKAGVTLEDHAKGELPPAQEPAKAARKGKAAKAAQEPAKAAQEPAKAQAAKAAQAAKSTFSIHVNKTGRVCFAKDAANRLGGLDAVDKYMALDIADGVVRMDITQAVTPTQIKNGGGRPYISATRQFKNLGFTPNSNSYDIEANPYGTSGFEFAWADAKPSTAA